jgi:hypothetical protein
MYFRLGTPRYSRVLFLSAALVMAGLPPAGAAEPWDYVRVSRDDRAAPKWISRHGKAQVDIRGDRLEIRIAYTDADDGLSHGAVMIAGTIGRDHTINATGTFLNTDANPIQMTGRYLSRHDLEMWGEKQKIVTSREIVFPHPPNTQFWGFLARDVRDE